jgi:hypothetical protein
MKPLRFILFLGLVLFAASAEVYEVGPGKPLEKIAAVPWDDLKPGDEVRIHWREEPYREKWTISARGTQEAPIVVKGILSPEGRRPVIDGDEAEGVRGQKAPHEARSVVRIGNIAKEPERRPAWIVLENLVIRNGYETNGFFDSRGERLSYAGNAAGLFVDVSQNVTIRNCVIHGNSNGLFAASEKWEPTRDLTVTGCFIFGNGTPGSIYRHNVYTEVSGLVLERNFLGPLREAAGGNNLKDRSSRLVIRENWIEGGNRQLDIVESDMPVIQSESGYHEALVERNVLIENAFDGNRQMVHYGGDGEVVDVYRRGPLRMTSNTILTRRLNETVLMLLNGLRPDAILERNVIWCDSPRAQLAILEGNGRVKVNNNWIRRGWNPVIHSPESVAVFGTGWVEGAAPGFVDFEKGDFRLKPAAPARLQGKPLGAVGDGEPFPVTRPASLKGPW